MRRLPVLARALLGTAVLLSTGLVGCVGPGHTVRPTMAADLEDLQSNLEILPPFPEPAPASGSLWTDAGPGAALARDTRAFRINDLVTIVLQEQSSGTNQADTDLSRSSSTDFGAEVLFGLEDTDPQPGSFNLNQVLRTSSSNDFEGEGTTSRSNLLSGSLTTRVMRVLPNGDLVIAGQKTVMINRERQILTLVGTTRPVDVDARNRVASTDVGDLVVRLWGHGDVDDSNRQGWFARMMNRVWPF